MAKLLRADLARMGKSKTFLGCLIITLLVSFVITYIIVSASWMPFDEMDWDRTILAFSAIPIFTSAAFSALFIGEDHSGTIRNKLIIGRTRVQIYFSNLIISVFGGFILAAFGTLPPLTVALIGGRQCFVMGAESFSLGILVCVCALISSCAIFTLIGMLITKKATSVTLTLILMIGAYAVTPTIRNWLDIPQTYMVTQLNEDGTVNRVFEEENPEAVRGGMRVFLETTYNTLPFGQIKLAQTKTDTRPFLPLYSLGAVVVTTAAGAAVFRKKDLK
ncbi:MAG: hypothetical protein K2J80_13640 [Oscillospiraceae bacterium]|nr:hypothetical protein [Oscillospiraceae bacterium]